MWFGLTMRKSWRQSEFVLIHSRHELNWNSIPEFLGAGRPFLNSVLSLSKSKFEFTLIYYAAVHWPLDEGTGTGSPGRSVRWVGEGTGPEWQTSHGVFSLAAKGPHTRPLLAWRIYWDSDWFFSRVGKKKTVIQKYHPKRCPSGSNAGGKVWLHTLEVHP